MAAVDITNRVERVTSGIQAAREEAARGFNEFCSEHFEWLDELPSIIKAKLPS